MISSIARLIQMLLMQRVRIDYAQCIYDIYLGNIQTCNKNNNNNKTRSNYFTKTYKFNKIW